MRRPAPSRAGVARRVGTLRGRDLPVVGDSPERGPCILQAGTLDREGRVAVLALGDHAGAARPGDRVAADVRALAGRARRPPPRRLDDGDARLGGRLVDDPVGEAHSAASFGARPVACAISWLWSSVVSGQSLKTEMGGSQSPFRCAASISSLLAFVRSALTA